jgi:hypothetical protein
MELPEQQHRQICGMRAIYSYEEPKKSTPLIVGRVITKSSAFVS